MGEKVATYAELNDFINQVAPKLRKIKLGSHTKISEMFLREMTMQIGLAETFTQDLLEIGMITYLLGEDLGRCLIKYPDGWWNAFKERWYPDWLKQRYPVQFIEHWTHSQVIYPELDIPSLPTQRQIHVTHLIDKPNEE